MNVLEFNSPASFSAVDLYNGNVINEVLANDPNKDIQLRDEAGLSINFYFRSGDLALNMAGSKTRISAPITKSNGDSVFTKAEFDALSNINGLDISDPGAFFGFGDRTRFFNTIPDPSTPNVYAFWLEGRSTLLGKNVFGLIYLNSSTTAYSVRIDVKVNQSGRNLFDDNY